VGELVEHEAVIAEVDGAVKDANKAVSKAESIKTYRIVAEDFTIESGELTPTLKLKRSVVATNHAAVIEEIYS
jgi:long-chain acyl-CoA synthetase